MTNGNSFGVVKKAIEEVTDMFIGYIEEILAFLTVCFVIPAGIEIFCHDIAVKLRALFECVSINRIYNYKNGPYRFRGRAMLYSITTSLA